MQVGVVSFRDSPLSMRIRGLFFRPLGPAIPASALVTKLTSGLIITLGTVLVAWISRRSILQPSSHGFPRFIAFEAILVLVVINAPFWLAHPLAINQLVSWLLLAASLVAVVWGAVLLQQQGKPTPTSQKSAVYGWENTSTLVTDGIYRYIRHPMYASLLYLAWGAAFKSLGVAAILLALVSSVALFLTAKVEERENVVSFGEAYRSYMEQTRRFVPFLF
jgi:protein-S-isoprenylcysteine O-methyltransferase Ste14